MLKGAKIRLYPNATQRTQLCQMFGNNRFLWNRMLEMAKERYQMNPSSYFINGYAMNYLLPLLKKEYPFLKESDSSSLQVCNQFLDQAFQNLFAHRGKYPRFKSRHNNIQSYTGKSVTLKPVAKRYLKIPKLGYMKSSKTSQIQNAKIKRYTITKDATNRYYLSLQLEFEPQALPKTGKSVGIDMGLHDEAITSDGLKFAKFESNDVNRKISYWQSHFDRRKNQATKAVRMWNHNHQPENAEELNDYQNWQKARIHKARLQKHLSNQRHDYLQKLTTMLVQKYDLIVIEDLKAKNLLKNHHLAKSISNAAWHEFRTMLEYKCNWYDKTLVIVNPAYTTQTCHNCGYILGSDQHSQHIDLSVRAWTCPHCGILHDRDQNAALNILQKGQAKLAQNK